MPLGRRDEEENPVLCLRRADSWHCASLRFLALRKQRAHLPYRRPLGRRDEEENPVLCFPERWILRELSSTHQTCVAVWQQRCCDGQRYHDQCFYSCRSTPTCEHWP